MLGRLSGVRPRAEPTSLRLPLLVSDQVVARVTIGHLGTRLPDTDFTEVDLQLHGWVVDGGARSRRANRDDAEIAVRGPIRSGHD